MATEFRAFNTDQLTETAQRAAAERSLDGLRDLLDAYLEVKQASEVTRMNYRSRLKLVMQFVSEMDVDLLKPDFDLGEQFLRAMADQDFKTETIRAYATVFRSLYEALAWAKLVRFDPFFMIDISKFLLEYRDGKGAKG